MSLAERILAALETASRPLLAREIVDNVNADRLGIVDKTAVNRCLYGQLRGRVSQDRGYRWFLSNRLQPVVPEAAGPQALIRRASPQWARFTRLVSYYLDCVREDEGFGARTFLNDVGNKYLPFPLEREWGLEGTANLDLPVSESERRFAGQLRQRGAGGAIFYGYPLFVEWLVAHDGRQWGFAIPVFLQAVEYDLAGNDLSLRLIAEWPRPNPEFLKKVFRSPEERRSFLAELGLLEAEGDPPKTDSQRLCGEWWPKALPARPSRRSTLKVLSLLLLPIP